jgi:hypothetical protein
MNKQQRIANVVKSVPLVGPVFKVSYAGLALAQCATHLIDRNEMKLKVKSSLQFDVANLMPQRIYHNLKRSISYLDKDLAKGVWLGKRTLSISPFGLSTRPGIDVFHWAVLIDGHLFQVGKNNEDKKKIRIEVTPDELEINTFKWLEIADSISERLTMAKIHEYAVSYERLDYALVPTFSPLTVTVDTEKKQNCQFFVGRMINFACNVDISQLDWNF